MQLGTRELEGTTNWMPDVGGQLKRLHEEEWKEITYISRPSGASFRFSQSDIARFYNRSIHYA